jgi:hypothetical protein
MLSTTNLGWKGCERALTRSGLRGSQGFDGPPIGSPDFWRLPLAMPDEKPRTLNRMTRNRFVARREVRATYCSANCPRKRKRAEPAATPDLPEAAWARACTEDSRKLKVDISRRGGPCGRPFCFWPSAICDSPWGERHAAKDLRTRRPRPCGQNAASGAPRCQVDIMASGHDVFLTHVRSCDIRSALSYLAPAELARGRRVQNKKEAATRRLLP